LGIDSLERGIELLRQATGVTAVFGGAHPGRGTHNALLSLGPGRYLELMAPDPHQGRTPENAGLFALHTLTPVGWAVHAENADQVLETARANGLPGGMVRPGSRQRPDGTTLRWRTLDPWGTESDVLPFFIEWAPGSPHPSTDAPGGCTLAALQLASPEPDSLRATLARAGVQVDVVRGPREAISLTLDCPAGRVRFPAAR
ncbi:MAG TPA: VOC family protein, partial [Longimicrobium sp.]|nr:VOC family protein [Longimicrobium sp.]